MRRQIGIYAGILLLGLATAAHAVDSPQAQVEVLQTQATISYHQKDYSKTLSILDKVLSADPKNIAAYELAALTQRQMKNDDAAAKLYEKLIKISKYDQRAPYYFELAMVRYKQKDIKAAHRYFEKAVWGNFNPGTSSFYLGVMDFNAKNWRGARKNLTAAMTYSDSSQMEPVTRYYLANTYAQLGQTATAIQKYREIETNYEETKRKGGTIDPLVGDLRNNALKELKNFERGNMYLNLSLLSQYDNNVQTNPITATDAQTNSSKKSAKAVISVSAGGSTSPTKPIQATAGYNFFTNYNANYLARDFNFMTHTGKLLAMYNPAGRFSAGVKSELTFSMKNNLIATDQPSAWRYRPFSTTVDLGPIAKYELTPRIALGAEVYYRPKYFYLDPPSGDSRRTGAGVFSRLTAEFVTPFTWFAPLAYTSFEWDHPRGKTFRVYALGLGIANAVQITDKFVVTPAFDFLSSDYYDVLVPKRDDRFLSYKVAGTYVLTPQWTALGDITYMQNVSTLTSSYGYNRFVSSLGASYNF